MGTPKRHFSYDFKLNVLKEYYAHEISAYAIKKKYPISCGMIKNWIKKYPITSEALSLSEEVIQSHMGKIKGKSTKQLTREEELELEIKNLRKSLAYSELRVEAFQELIKIGKEEYGIDLLKKMAPSSNKPSPQTWGDLNKMSVWIVWQDQRRILLHKARRVRQA